MDTLQNVTSTICRTPLWDPSVSWDTASPDFTPCFRKTVLAWFPGTFLLLMLPFHIIQRRNSLFPEISPSSLYNKKMVSIGFMLMIQIAVFLWAVNVYRMDGEFILIDWLSPLVASGYLLLTLYITCMERKHGIMASGILFFFWLLSFVCQLGIFQSELRETLQTSEYLTFNFLQHLMTFIITVQMFLTTFVRETPDFLRNPNKNEEMPSPMLNAPFLSYMSTFWMTSFILDGFKNTVKRSDLFEVPKYLKCENLAPAFECKWTKEKERVARLNNLKRETPGQTEDIKNVPNVFRPLFQAFWAPFCFLPLARLMSDCTAFMHPFLIKLMLYFAENPDDYRWKGFAFITILFIVKISETFLHKVNQHYYHKFHHLIVSTLQCAAYKKTMVMSNSSRKSTTVGEMNSLLSSDIPKIPGLLHTCQDAWSVPLRVIIGFYLLHQEVGSAVWCAVLVVLVCIPINIYMSKLGKKFHEIYKEHSDNRAKVISEVINGIKVIKLYAWEKSFLKHIEGIRNDETYQLAKIRIKDAFGRLLWDFTPQLIGILVFGTYAWYGHHLTTSTIFVCLSLIDVISYPMTALPHIINFAIEAKVSAKKLQDFMALDELDMNAIQHEPSKGMSITVKDAEFSWCTDSKEKTLKSLNFEAKTGSLVAVVGSVGSGKSSLCSALLGEMEKVNGEAHVKGSIAYVPQQPWIQNQTLQDNILFGKTKYCKRYNKVLQSCALKTDLDMFAGGDQTEIGEKGINLSGGQKQRVSLARAVYQNADIYLLDDPLSAVDPHVGKHIFRHVLGPKGMLKHKTRILVTHALHVLPEVDKIIVLTKGEITEMGSYEDLIQSNGAFSELVRNFSLEQQAEENKVDQSVLEKSDTLSEESDSESDITEYTSSGSDSERNDDSDEDDAPENTFESLNEKYAKLMTDDVIATGKVKGRVFSTFFKSIGIKATVVFLVMKFGVEFIEAFTSKWHKEWSQDIPTGNSTLDTEQNMYRLKIYTVLSGVWGVGCVLYLVALAFCSRNGSVVLHKKLLHAVFRYPMSFFDTTPIGRITTKFSSDMDTIDHALPSRLEWCFHHGLIAIVSMVVVATEIPVVMIAFVPLLLFCVALQHVYGTTSRQLKRIESVSRSPIYSHYSESIQGLSTIRAYKQEERFYKMHEEKRDEFQTCIMAVMTSNMWLDTFLGLLGNLVVLFCLLCAFYQKDFLTGASIGIILNFAMRITGDTNALLQHLSELDKNMVSAEKVIEYSELKEEAADIVEENRPEQNWPSKGKIEFINYGTRYREELDLVIKNINFVVQPGEKVGIVGRTGAGKSSLTLALFRIIEKAEGCIEIDGHDISKIGLHDLRSRLTIIPQDPVMFSGTIRRNLDPFEEYTDEQLWEAIEHAHLKTYIDSLPNKLEYECAEDGKNLSVGQRQLICLARALLRKTKVLVLDEATAAVDLETDNLIQSTIRTEFSSCTIFTIAHRLNTIIDYDKILVLDAGELAEFDSPSVLLSNEKGHFAQMAKDAGLALKENDSDSGLELSFSDEV